MFTYTTNLVEGENFARIGVHIHLHVADQSQEIMYFRTHKQEYADYIGTAIIQRLERELAK